MNLAEALILGAVQGLTEFLPISSSGHLALGHWFLGGATGENDLLFDVFVHVGTLVAVFAVFGRDVLKVITDTFAVLVGVVRTRSSMASLLQEKPFAMLGLMIVLATIPTGLIGLFFGDSLVNLTTTPITVGVALLVNAAILMSVKVFRRTAVDYAGGAGDAGDAVPGAGSDIRGARLQQPVSSQAVSSAAVSQNQIPFQGVGTLALLRTVLIIGIGQGLAITRGISRSGTTISLALLLGLKQEEAARFSFMLSIPAILGAMVLELGKVEPGAMLVASGSAAAAGAGAGMGLAQLLPYVAGFVVAALVGYLALKFLLGVLRKGGLHYFAIYCFVLGATAIAYSII